MKDETSLTESRNELMSSMRGRGLIGSVMSENAALDRKIVDARLKYPSAFRYSDIMNSPKSHRYRTGSENGVPVMTHDDFARLVHDEEVGRRRKKIRLLKNSEGTSGGLRPAAPYYPSTASMTRGRHQTVLFDKTESEWRVTNKEPSKLPGKIVRVLDSPPIVKAPMSLRSFSDVFAACSIIFIVILLLAFMVFIKIQIHNESVELHTLENRYASAQREVASLQTELDDKNNRFTLEQMARNMNYMSINRVAPEVIHFDDSVTLYPAKKSDVTIPSLLTALGIRIDKNEGQN